MRNFISVFINGRGHCVRGPDAFRLLADYLRNELGLTGTKVVCAEGDCGACTVLLGRWSGGRFVYRIVNSCILFMHQLDRTHVITVEGLTRQGRLHPAQEAMIEHHGSQCGYCTPGFVMALAGIFENQIGKAAPPSEEEIRAQLSGNLCRCTGYVQIVEAARSIDPARVEPLSALYPEEPMRCEFEALGRESVRIEAGANGAGENADEDGGHRRRVVFLPATLDEALEFRAAEPDSAVLCGATDLAVQYNKGRIDPQRILGLNAIDGLDKIEWEDGAGANGENGTLVIGAAASWARIAESLDGRAPEFEKILSLFGSPQIRNAGAIGGNIANASPIADAAPFLAVMEAEIEAASRASGRRRIPITRFYLAYKKIDLRPDELIIRVRVPLPAPGDLLRLYKVSRRRDLDIATFNAAVLVRLDDSTAKGRNGSAGAHAGPTGARIGSARIAYGGVAPTLLRLPRTEAFLAGRPFEEATFREAGRMARGEIAPISDVRGSAAFRAQLSENILLKFYRDCAAAASPAANAPANTAR